MKALSSDLARIRNLYFEKDDLRALVAYMAEFEGKQRLSRTDITPMEAYINGYGGKGYSMSSARFFNAVQEAIDNGLVLKEGDILTGITYALTPKGQRWYEQEIKPQLEDIAMRTRLNLEPEQAAFMANPHNRITGENARHPRELGFVERMQAKGDGASLEIRGGIKGRELFGKN